MTRPSFGPRNIKREAPFWAATISVAGRDAGSACGVLNTGGNIVGGVGALLVPITVGALGWPAALATGTAFAMIGALLWFWIRADATIGGDALTRG